MLSRRGLLFGAAAVAAPAIIRPGLLMPVKQMLLPDGVALSSIEHPISPWMMPRDLTEKSLLEMLMEIQPLWPRRHGLVLHPTHLVVPNAS